MQIRWHCHALNTTPRDKSSRQRKWKCWRKRIKAMNSRDIWVRWIVAAVWQLVFSVWLVFPHINDIVLVVVFFRFTTKLRKEGVLVISRILLSLACCTMYIYGLSYHDLNASTKSRIPFRLILNIFDTLFLLLDYAEIRFKCGKISLTSQIRGGCGNVRHWNEKGSEFNIL